MGRGRPSGRDELWERETPRGRTSPDEGVGRRGERWQGGSVEILSKGTWAGMGAVRKLLRISDF